MEIGAHGLPGVDARSSVGLVLEHVIVFVTIHMQITVGILVWEEVMKQSYAVCLIVLLMETGEPGPSGQTARVIVVLLRDIVHVTVLILHLHMADGVVKVKLRNIVTAT